MIALQSFVVLLEFFDSSINVETLAYATIIIAVCLCFLVPEAIFYYRMRKQEKRKKRNKELYFQGSLV